MVRLIRPIPAAPAAAPATTPQTEVLPPETGFDELDPREARFVAEYAARSGTRGAGAEAALAAGYSNGNRNAAHSMASRLLRRPAVLKALKDEIGRRFAAAAVLGVAVMENLAQSARSEQVRLSAAKELVDRGYGPIVSRNANVNVNTNVEDMIAALDAQEAMARGDRGPTRGR